MSALLKYYVMRVISKIVVPNMIKINRAKEKKEHRPR
jgi:hypothetical protein